MKILYLVHRLPYPPNKGDKVRSYHLLKHLAARHRVFVGTFIDDPDDQAHIGTVAAMCSELHVARLSPRRARPASLAGLLTRQPLTLRYYRDAGLKRWVEDTCAGEQIDAALVFSSSMAQYTQGLPQLPMLVDFVDIDSAKWGQYANSLGWPRSWLYRRESTLLLAYERAVATRAEHSFFVTENETALFRKLAPECASTVRPLRNGVDSDYFSPDPARRSPFISIARETPAEDEPIPIVFTGAMDYWPNVDAVAWFAEAVLPSLRAIFPSARLHVVGRNPDRAVRALACEAVEVTGTVPDVRPYLQHAAVIIAPLRIARGVQNKVLEAMAMARPVVASATCAAGIDAEPGRELLTADTAQEFVGAIEQVLREPRFARLMGDAARRCVLRHYSWESQFAGIDEAIAAISLQH